MSIGTAIVVTLLSLLPSHFAIAEKPQATQNNLEPAPRAGKPPQQAIEICVSKQENSSCRFQGPSTLESGVCEFTPDKQYFACNPNREDKQSKPQKQTMTNKQVKQLPSPYKDN